MASKIIALAGRQGCGKGTIAKYAAEKLAAKTFRYSDVLREVLSVLGEDVSRGNLQSLSSLLRAVFGDELLSKALAKKVASVEGIVIIDGVRRLEDLDAFKDFPDMKLIFVDSYPTVRYERIMKRRENSCEETKTLEEFLEEEEAEAEKRIDFVREKADWLIENNHSMHQLQSRLDVIFEQVG